ncbi:MAG TPA: hypothetical protein VF342_01635 [Alphaproteobacteria bacterium]
MGRFIIRPGHWYAWHMFPGSADAPHITPIRVDGVAQADRGRILRLKFWSLDDPTKAQDLEIELRVHLCTATHLAAVPVGVADRTVVVCDISFRWIEEFRLRLLAQNPRHSGEDVQAYLQRVSGAVLASGEA